MDRTPSPAQVVATLDYDPWGEQWQTAGVQGDRQYNGRVYDPANGVDGEVRDVKPGMCILIPPGVRHRANGRMKVVSVASPKFDPNDEWLD